MIHRNCFEILDKKLYLEHMRGKRGGFNTSKFRCARYILHAFSFKDSLSKNNFVYQDDYYYVDGNMKIIQNDSVSNFRKDVWTINHNTIKYLLKNNIIGPVNSSSMALISLLYK